MYSITNLIVAGKMGECMISTAVSALTHLGESDLVNIMDTDREKNWHTKLPGCTRNKHQYSDQQAKIIPVGRMHPYELLWLKIPQEK